MVGVEFPQAGRQARPGQSGMAEVRRARRKEEEKSNAVYSGEDADEGAVAMPISQKLARFGLYVVSLLGRGFQAHGRVAHRQTHERIHSHIIG